MLFLAKTESKKENKQAVLAKQAADALEKYWELLSKLQEGKLKHLMRVHIKFPYKPQRIAAPQITISEIGSTGLTVSTTILDITLDNIKTCNLFSPQFADRILSMYKQRKSGNLDDPKPFKKAKK
jgi:hypothetical protein